MAAAYAKRGRYRSSTIVILMSLAVHGVHGAAIASTEEAGVEAVAAVRRTLQSAGRIVEQNGTRNQKLLRLRELARSLFDTEAMAREAMGDVLERQPEERQREFVELFDEFIVRAYLQKLLFFKQPRFAFGRVEVSRDRAVVHTRIQTKKDEYYIDYVMRRDEDAWYAVDIVVENVSLTRNYGEQFQSLLRKQSFDDLLDRLRRKVERHRSGDSA